MNIMKKAVAASLSLGVLTISANAQSPEEFYSGNTVRVLVGYSAGGGYDAYGRLLARYIGNYIPGNPDIVVENMPGAGSLTLANHLANVAPRDGTVIGLVDRGVAVLPLLSTSPVQYDSETFSWLGSLTNDVYVCFAWHESGIDDWADVMDGSRQIIMGGNGPDANNERTPRMMANLLGADIRIISGYPGSAEVNIAMEQGEVDGMCGSWGSVLRQRADWLEDNRINLLVQFGNEPAPGLEDVPLIYDFIEEPEDAQVIALIMSHLEAAYPFITPPDVPEDRLAVLEQAFLDAAADPALRAEAERTFMEINPISGSELAEFIGGIYETSPEVVERARQVLATQ